MLDKSGAMKFLGVGSRRFRHLIKSDKLKPILISSVKVGRPKHFFSVSELTKIKDLFHVAEPSRVDVTKFDFKKRVVKKKVLKISIAEDELFLVNELSESELESRSELISKAIRSYYFYNHAITNTNIIYLKENIGNLNKVLSNVNQIAKHLNTEAIIKNGISDFDRNQAIENLEKLITECKDSIFNVIKFSDMSYTLVHKNEKS